MRGYELWGIAINPFEGSVRDSTIPGKLFEFCCLGGMSAKNLWAISLWLKINSQFIWWYFGIVLFKRFRKAEAAPATLRGQSLGNRHLDDCASQKRWCSCLLEITTFVQVICWFWEVPSSYLSSVQPCPVVKYVWFWFLSRVNGIIIGRRIVHWWASERWN